LTGAPPAVDIGWRKSQEAFMKINTEIPAVSECNVRACSFNSDNLCHARAITIGDGETPGCDTLYCEEAQVRATDIRAGVGACKVSSCTYNDDLHCQADSIRVGLTEDDVQCLSYSRR
jgi:hypothetical protein